MRPAALLPVLLLLGCDVSPEVAHERAVQACAAFVACDLDWPDLSWCVESATGRELHPFEPRPGDLSCVLSSRGDCDAIRACIGWSVRVPEGTCEERCEGGTLVHCVGGREHRVQCAHTAPGNTCLALPRDPGDPSLPRYACTTADCPASGSSSCVGRDLAVCGSGPLSPRRVHLCPEGTACGLYGEGSVTFRDCVGSGEACEESRCEGSVSRPCVRGRWGPSQDCAERGLACVNGFCEETFESLCRGTAVTQHCAGDTLVYCEHGRTTEVDCVALGFARCGSVESAGFGAASCEPVGGRELREPGL